MGAGKHREAQAMRAPGNTSATGAAHTGLAAESPATAEELLQQQQAQDIRRPSRAVWPLGPSAVLEAEGQERRLLRAREAHVRARKAAGVDAEVLWTEANPPACA